MKPPTDQELKRIMHNPQTPVKIRLEIYRKFQNEGKLPHRPVEKKLKNGKAIR